MVRRALVRPVSSSFGDALRHDTRGPAPDHVMARAQHAAYCRALMSIGLEVRVLSSLEQHPDACFLEDRLVAGWGRALVTRSRVASRRGEADTLVAEIGDAVALTVMCAGGLDGGDVIRLGDTLLVGLSERTDREGVEQLRRWVADLDVEVVSIPLESGLHLKCAATPLDRDTLLCVEAWPYRSELPAGVRVITVPEEEAYAANAVATDRGVLMAEGHPAAAAAVAATGRRVTTVDVSAFRRADGSLTCLSVLLPPA